MTDSSLRPPSSTAADKPHQTALLGFRVRDLELGVRLSESLEVLRMLELTPLADAPEIVVGIMDYRGTVVPVLDPAVKLGLPRRPPDLSTRLIVVEAQGHKAVLVADEVRGVVEIPDGSFTARAQLVAGSPPPDRGCVRGTVRRPEGLLIVIDTIGLLSSGEDADLVALLMARASTRLPA